MSLPSCPLLLFAAAPERDSASRPAIVPETEGFVQKFG
jgi:hypothetical protein